MPREKIYEILTFYVNGYINMFMAGWFFCY